MKLYDEEEFKRKKNKNKKTKNTIIVLIILLSILSIGIFFIIIYRLYNPDKITTFIDNVEIKNFDKLLDIHQNENGELEIYVPIKEIAVFLGYKSYNGDYNRASEEKDKCYVIKDNCEVAMFSLKSKTIYKKNLENKQNNNYDSITIDKAVYKSNDTLYTSIDGIEKAYNVSFKYDSKKKTIFIRTMDDLIKQEREILTKKEISDYGLVTIEENNYENYKSIFDDMLIIKTEDNKYGVINTIDYSILLEAKYDYIQYLPHSSDFLIETNKKLGIISKEGKTRVTPNYDELSLIDKNYNLYKIRKNNLYGVINNDEKIIIHPENEAIGINIDSFYYNDIKDGYIILNELIPVMQNRKWAFYNTKGKMVTDGFKYDDIGCRISNGNNVYSLLEIPGYNVIVVCSDRNYTFMDETGNDQILPFVFDSIYMKISSGELSYWMEYNGKQYDVLKYLEKKGVKNNNKK